MATKDKDQITRTIDGHEIRLTNLSKTMYPDTNFTKQDVADYFETVAGAAAGSTYHEDPLSGWHRGRAVL